MSNMVTARVDAITLAAQTFLFFALSMAVRKDVREDVDYAHIAGADSSRILSKERVV